MRSVTCLLVVLTSVASADANPVRVAIECESPGRTKACPAFLLGFIDSHKILLASPRAGADVIVYATATEVAVVDRLHLRFVGRMPGAPEIVELDVDVDTRATDDEQRAELERGFLQGVALFVAARHPRSVAVALSAPAEAGAKPAGSPLGLEVTIGANGNYTERFRELNGNLNILGRYVTKRRRALGGMFSNAGVERQPPLVLDDGTRVSLDSEQWFIRAGAEAVQLLNDHWSVGVGSFTNFEDDKAQYVYQNRSRVALEWDRFAADDPRGNRLGIFYAVGWITERYNIPNIRGERFATYPVHAINAFGSVRYDKISLGLQLDADAQLLHPTRRRNITIAPRVEIKLGDHVDLSLAVSLTQRTLPAPDETKIDPLDYEQLSRLSYAEPLSIGGTLNLSFHWDPTNGARNDRLQAI